MGPIFRGPREQGKRPADKREEGKGADRDFCPSPTMQTIRAYARKNETKRFPGWTLPQPPIYIYNLLIYIYNIYIWLCLFCLGCFCAAPPAPRNIVGNFIYNALAEQIATMYALANRFAKV